jgi:phenylacetate-CoA ligase
VRYNTRDQGGILSYTQAAALVKAPAEPYDFNDMSLVYLFGRRDLSLTFYALNIYIENIKYCLESFPLNEHFSGLYSMRVNNDERLDQQFEIIVELARGTEPNAELSKKLAEYVAAKLCQVNSEYAKLHSSLGKRADPSITFVTYGELDTMPGRKHRWVKRI